MDDKKDFTFDEKNFPVNEVKRFVKELHTANQKYVLILDPAIKVEKGYKPFEEAMREGIFMRNPDGSVYVGKVWPG
jgi:alpha-glucosidase (family GH31 glycosyl hydrolase)